MKEVGQTTQAKFADLHFHSDLSPDARPGMKPEQIVELALATNLSAIAITDHHDTKFAEDAQNYASQTNSPLKVIRGIEIDTSEGHVLGLYIEKPIPRTPILEKAVEEILKQGGLVVIPHPFMRSIGGKTIGLQKPAIERLSASGIVSGFEVHSQGIEDASKRRKKAVNSNIFARSHYGLHNRSLGAAISSSDGHGFAPGKARTAYEGDLLESIKNKTTNPVVLNEAEVTDIYNAAIKLFGFDAVFPEGSKARRRFEAEKSKFTNTSKKELSS